MSRCGWWVICALVPGAALQLGQARLWPSAAYGVIGLLGAGLLLPVWRHGRWCGVWAVLAGLALGFAQTGWRAQDRLVQRLAPELEGVDVLVRGRIDSLPVRQVEGWRFHFAVESGRRSDSGVAVTLPARLALGWYAGGGRMAAGQPAASAFDMPLPTPRPGELWQLPLRLQQPHGSVNPHGFDYELWLFEQGIGATGSVRQRGPALPQRLAPAGPTLDGWRWTLRHDLWQRLGDTPEAGVLAALVIGDQTAIGRSDWDVFRDTGVAHLMAISGLHVTMLAWLGSALVAWLWRRSCWLMLRCPAVQAGRLGGLLTACGYALLAGWGVPAQRTVLMLGMVWLMRRNARCWPWWLVLWLAAAGVVLLDPWALLQPGFWLSFGAVALLLLHGGWSVEVAGHGGLAQASVSEPAGGAGAASCRAHLRRWLTWLGPALRLQWLIGLALAPLTLLFFHQVSLIGLAANLVAIPWVTWVVTPLALLGVLLPPLWDAAALALQGLMWLLIWCAARLWASWHAAAPPFWLVLPALVGAALLMAPLPRALRLLGLALMLPLVDPPVPRPSWGQFELIAADVGQGSAVLIRTRRHTLLYDAGPAYGPGSDAGTRVLVPMLRALGIGRLDLLMLSHRDLDHLGGAATVLRQIGAWRLSSSLEPGHPLREIGPYQPCHAGQQWIWDGVRFMLVHPHVPDQHRSGQAGGRSNRLSCVLRVEAAPSQGADRRAGQSALLTGDIGRDEELELMKMQDTLLETDVLLIPHHGSAASSTREWVHRVKPKFALAQVGYRNRYGHPSPGVIERYRAHSTGVFRTDRCGAWHFNSADARYWCERFRARRYWHWAGSDDGLEFAKDLSFIDQPP